MAALVVAVRHTVGLDAADRGAGTGAGGRSARGEDRDVAGFWVADSWRVGNLFCGMDRQCASYGTGFRKPDAGGTRGERCRGTVGGDSGGSRCGRDGGVDDVHSAWGVFQQSFGVVYMDDGAGVGRDCALAGGRVRDATVELV